MPRTPAPKGQHDPRVPWVFSRPQSCWRKLQPRDTSRQTDTYTHTYVSRKACFFPLKAKEGQPRRAENSQMAALTSAKSQRKQLVLPILGQPAPPDAVLARWWGFPLLHGESPQAEGDNLPP